jgi:hypothetical protein
MRKDRRVKPVVYRLHTLAHSAAIVSICRFLATSFLAIVDVKPGLGLRTVGLKSGICRHERFQAKENPEFTLKIPIWDDNSADEGAVHWPRNCMFPWQVTGSDWPGDP